MLDLGWIISKSLLWSFKRFSAKKEHHHLLYTLLEMYGACKRVIVKVLISPALKKSWQFCFIQIFVELPWPQNPSIEYPN